MSYEIAAIIILFSSLIGIGVILFRKIPVLAELPDYKPSNVVISSPVKWYKNLKEKIKNISFFKSFSSGVFLQKILSKIRILSLKVENKIAFWLQKLRERSLKKKNLENDNYWEELKKPTNKEDKNWPA